MIYFDPDYLSQYLSMDVKLKVYVDGKYLSIADMSDIEDSTEGVGYRVDGSPATFDYRSIEHIKVGDTILTRDAFEKKLSGDDEAANNNAQSDETADMGGDMGGDLPDLDEPSPDEELPKEAINRILQNIINDNINKPYSGISLGMLVENTDTHSEYFRSKGIVNKIYSNGLVGYRSTNTGNNHRVSQQLFADVDALKEMA